MCRSCCSDGVLLCCFADADTQNLPAAYSPCASSSPLSELPDSPMNRSRSDAFGLAALNRRLGALGGWAGSSSNLSSASTASNPSSMASKLAQRTTADSLFSQGGGRPLVEGSLDSVTACSRGQHVTCGMRHAPAGLHGRRVQGLAEMHEGNVLKKPLKAIFIPPREVRLPGCCCCLCDNKSGLYATSQVEAAYISRINAAIIQKLYAPRQLLS